MKWIAIVLAISSGILASLYVTIGGTVLAIALSVTSMVVLIIGVFSLGIWYAHQSIQLGAKLALDSQRVNDQWDAIKTKGLTQFGGEMIKLAKSQSSADFPRAFRK